MADRVLKDGDTFSMRWPDGSIAGFRWWMPGILRTLVEQLDVAASAALPGSFRAMILAGSTSDNVSSC
jgi:hypothetical protein